MNRDELAEVALEVALVAVSALVAIAAMPDQPQLGLARHALDRITAITRGAR